MLVIFDTHTTYYMVYSLYVYLLIKKFFSSNVHIIHIYEFILFILEYIFVKYTLSKCRI
jgi:hypothetical protein